MNDLYYARAFFAKQCVEKQLYYTLCLLSCCEIETGDNFPFIAALSTVDKLVIHLHTDMLDLFNEKPQAFCSVMFHEIRHITQMTNMIKAWDYIDLSPLYDKACEMKAACGDPVVEKHWDNYMAAIDDRKNKSTQALLSTACNIGMDAADNVDVLRIWGHQATSDVDDFCLERMKARGEQIDGFLGATTPEKLSKLFGVPLDMEQEWVYFSAKYIEYLAKQLNDPNQVPITYVGYDGHDFGANSDNPDAQSKAQKNINSATSRAAGEAKVMGHHAGKGCADINFMADSLVNLNSRVKSLVDKMKFMIKKIFVPSPEEIYTYQKANRMWPGFDLPGTINVDKPKPAVVVVIDVSGSMWNDQYLNQMCAAARYMHKKGLLAGMYSFDTVLTKVAFDGKAPKVALVGGGGTTWEPGFTETILKDLGAKKFDMLLLSDMAITGLAELKDDVRVKLHPIDIGEHFHEK